MSCLRPKQRRPEEDWTRDGQTKHYRNYYYCYLIRPSREEFQCISHLCYSKSRITPSDQEETHDRGMLLTGMTGTAFTRSHLRSFLHLRDAHLSGTHGEANCYFLQSSGEQRCKPALREGPGTCVSEFPLSANDGSGNSIQTNSHHLVFSEHAGGEGITAGVERDAF